MADAVVDAVADAGAPAARLTDVSYAYRAGGSPTQVIQDFTLNVPSAAVTLLRGPSGCGKSTVLRLLAGMSAPDQGLVEVAGIPLNRLGRGGRARVRARHIGYLFQNPPENLLEELTAVQQVVFGARLRGVRTGRESALQSLADVGVAELADRRVAEVSGGQQQRIAVAAVLAGGPGLIVADEPTAELDSRNGEVILDLLAGVARAGRAVVIASHEPSARRVADHTVDMVTNGDVTRDR